MIDLQQTQSQAYSTRISELRDLAADDGYSLSSASEADFWRFIRSEPRLRRGNLVLIDNGNLRAVWKDGHENQMGLQFLGESMVQYVIFKRREPDHPISRVAGRDTLKGLKRQIDVFELGSFRS